MGIAIGTFCKVVGLKNTPQLNGRHVEVLRGAELVSVPIVGTGKVETFIGYGVAFVTSPDVSGFMREENLEPCQLHPQLYRSIWIHETGMEPPNEQ